MHGVHFTFIHRLFGSKCGKRRLLQTTDDYDETKRGCCCAVSLVILFGIDHYIRLSDVILGPLIADYSACCIVLVECRCSVCCRFTFFLLTTYSSPPPIIRAARRQWTSILFRPFFQGLVVVRAANRWGFIAGFGDQRVPICILFLKCFFIRQIE